MALGKVQSLIVSKLIAMGRLTPEQRDAIAARPQDLNGDALDRLLQEDYKITAFQCLVAKGRALGLAPYNVARYKISASTFERIPQEFCSENLVLPVGQVGDLLLVAFANPFEVTLPAKIQEMTGKRVVRLLAREKDIKDKFSRANDQSSGFDDVVQKIGAEYGSDQDSAIITDSDVNEESGPIIQLGNRIIEDAYFAGSSDIHIEPQEKEVIVRYRVDGMCQEKLRLPVKVGPALVARLKIMCNLDISERRLPQDGRIVFKQYTKKNLDLDLRVSTAPLNYGEGVVMRILDKQKSTLPLTSLGFSEENLARYRDCIRQPARHDPALRADRLGKVDDALRRAQRDQHPRHRDPHGRGPDRVHAPGDQPDADAQADRADARDGAALLPSPGPGHHTRGRNSRR